MVWNTKLMHNKYKKYLKRNKEFKSLHLNDDENLLFYKIN